MEMKLKLELKNVFGGDGITRIEKVEEVKLVRTKKTSRTQQEVGVQIDSATDERQTQLVDKEIHTFQRDEKNKPLLRLGGTHGKLWGTMKASGAILVEIGTPGFKSKAFIGRVMQMVNIYPSEVVLEGANGMEIKKLPQMLEGFGNKMITQWFDVIPKCKCSLTIQFPDSIRPQVEKMLRQVQQLSCLNKRRGNIKILNWK